MLKQLMSARSKLVKSLVHFSDEQARQIYDRRGFTFQKLSGPTELIKEFEALEAARLDALMKEEAEVRSPRKGVIPPPKTFLPAPGMSSPRKKAPGKHRKEIAEADVPKDQPGEKLSSD